MSLSTNDNEIMQFITNVVELVKENMKLRNIFEFTMDSYMKILPPEYLEQGMELGRKIIDEIIYALPFLDI